MSVEPRYGPAGWPRGVLPPGVDEWERSVTGYLLDCCAPDLRSHALLRRHPVVLTGIVDTYAEAGLEATRRGLAEVRTDLRRRVPVEAIEAAVLVWQAEQERWMGVRRAVDLIEDGLRRARPHPWASGP